MTSARRPRSVLAQLAIVGVVASSSVALGTGSAAAAAPVVTSLVFSGAEQTYVVPAGVYSLDVVVNGGSGGDSFMGTAQGGAGASVTGTINVQPGETLYVEVGGRGTDGNTNGGPQTQPHPGGFNGGGSTSSGFGGADGEGGASGGGASDIRTCARDAASCVGGGTTLDSRLIVAGGGGGAGSDGKVGASPRAGGNGGTAGAGGGPSPGVAGAAASTEPGGNPGAQGGSAAGGAGGPGVNHAPGDLSGINGLPGDDGILGQGGSTPALDNGGGGGGGFYGGGAGGGGASDNSSVHGGGGGGGAGSSFGGTITSGPANNNGAVSITTVPSPPPTVSLTAATAKSSSTASVTGTVNAHAFPVTACVFSYGKTKKLGTKVQCSPGAGSITGSSPTSVSATLTGLKPGTKYYAALVAVGAGGAVATPAKAFNTKPAKPSVAKTKVKSITSSSAQLFVKVKTGGGKTSIVVKYGATKNYSAQSKTITVAAKHKTAVKVIKVKGLKSGTSYHAAAFVANSAGGAAGKDVRFKTK